MIAVSACLLGMNCRYDSKIKRDSELLKTLKCKDILPICPEVNILGSPREAIDLIKNDSVKAVGRETKKDYTPALQKEAKTLFENFPKINTFILKSKSPSCGVKSVMLFDKSALLVSETEDGVFYKELKKLYNNAKFFSR
jgi:uncharacterized protein YbbK (DUF523 family)